MKKKKAVHVHVHMYMYRYRGTSTTRIQDLEGLTYQKVPTTRPKGQRRNLPLCRPPCLRRAAAPQCRSCAWV
eukprot:SAG11_NODE_3651_length_2310_cov_1.335142_2_plen_72_part_00